MGRERAQQNRKQEERGGRERTRSRSIARNIPKRSANPKERDAKKETRTRSPPTARRSKDFAPVDRRTKEATPASGRSRGEVPTARRSRQLTPPARSSRDRDQNKSSGDAKK